MKGYLYILECKYDNLYTGSTKNIEKRMTEHFSGLGSDFTRRYPPIKLLYFEEHQRIDDAFYREKQIQKWTRKKKLALIDGNFDTLKELSKCFNISNYLYDNH